MDIGSRTLEGENGARKAYELLYFEDAKRDDGFKQSDISIRTKTGIIYSYSAAAGFAVSFDNGYHWSVRNDGLPLEQIYPYVSKKIRRLTSINAECLNEKRVAVTTMYGIFWSDDFGKTWTELPTCPPISVTDTFTCVALKPGDDKSFLVGTSFTGFYETNNSGAAWSKPAPGLRSIYRGAGYYETIRAIAYHPANENDILFSTDFENRIYRFDMKEKKTTDIYSPRLEKGEHITQLSYEWIIRKRDDSPSDPIGQNTGTAAGQKTSGSNKKPGVIGSQVYWIPSMTTDRSLFAFDSGKRTWEKTSATGPVEMTYIPEAKLRRMELAKNRYGIYITAYHAGIKAHFNEHLDFLKTHKLNAVVVEAKDDLGLITYDSKLPIARAIDAVDKRMNIEDIIRKLHENKIWCVARVIVFKDKNLFGYDHNRYALWDKITQAPWSNPKEQWVDPYSEFVWSYNIDIAEELQKAGVDEIQFDYVRFPTDGATERIDYRYRKNGQTKIEALKSFLVAARERITIPISIDVYGFNAWFDMGNNMGQNIAELSEYADVVCPMFYPSHFPGAFYSDMEYIAKARFIYEDGSNRAYAITAGRSIIRPYVQAFLMREEKFFSDDEQARYFSGQLEGTASSEASGFVLWNSANNYYMAPGTMMDRFPGSGNPK